MFYRGSSGNFYPWSLLLSYKYITFKNCWKDDKVGELLSGVELLFQLPQPRFWLHPNCSGKREHFVRTSSGPITICQAIGREESFKYPFTQGLSSELTPTMEPNLRTGVMKWWCQVHNLWVLVQNQDVRSLVQKARKKAVKGPKISAFSSYLWSLNLP